MVTISLCMIVKNEEKILARCLDCVADLVDEIIVVDTGSTDATKEIAKRYTDKIYDFQWIDDFSAARNFAFSKATMEYIYTADADEVINEENRQRFRIMKECLLPEIEIVQMKYGNQLQNGSVYNFDEEYRPKLMKRQRQFIWEGAIHETIRTTPVIYDSDIVITHMQEASHASRDLKTFHKQILKGVRLDKRLHHMYACELYMAGEASDFTDAFPYFQEAVEDVERSQDEIIEACLVLARGARYLQEDLLFFQYTTKVIALDGCAEVCYELGSFYEEHNNPKEAVIWYFNAVNETQPVLSIHTGGKDAINGLIRCYRQMGLLEQAKEYEEMLLNYE